MGSMRVWAFLILLVVSSCGTVTQQELDARLAGISSRLTQLEERQKKLEEQQVRTEERIDLISQNITSLRLELERLRANRTVMETPKVDQPPPASQGQTQGYEKDYEEAMRLYHLRQLHQAKEKFIDFIKKNPKTPLTDNAYLWLGVVYRDLGDWQKAQAVWLTLVERCKRGEMVDCNKLPAVYLQLAKLYEQRNDQQKAKEYYEAILKEFPLSEEANIAKAKLGR